MKKTLLDICTVPVRFSEIDMMGRAWHGSFVAYMEDGRESFGRHYPGIGYGVMKAAGIYAPIYDMHIRYLAPLEMGDVAEIHTRYDHKPGARLDYSYEIYRGSDHKLCVQCATTRLFINANGELMTDKPDYYEAWQKKFLE